MATPESTDKRKGQRAESPRVVVRIPSIDRFRQSYLKDISDGGLFVKAQKQLPLGSFVMLELWPPGWDEAAQLSAKVVRTVDPAKATPEAPAGMALQFVAIPPEIEARLHALVRELAEEESSAEGEDLPGASVARIEEMVGELELLREKVSLLETELTDSRGQIQALTEHATRLVEVQDELDTAQAKVAAGERRVAELEGKLATERKAAVEAREEAKEARELAKESRESATKAREEAKRLSAELDKTKALDRDLRRALGKAAGKPAGKKPGAASRPIAPEDEDEVIVEDLDGSSDPAAAALFEEPKEEDGTELELGLDDLDLGDDAGSLDGSSPLEPERAAAGPTFEEFGKRLGPKTRLIGTDALGAHTPVEEGEALIAELISASPTYSTLLSQVGEKLDAERVRRVLFDLSAKELIELR
ncbi:MAG: PilZ domain-containing protein [Deltaproteobacteria bacterium]